MATDIIDPRDLMNPADFNSIRVKVMAENVTTRTRFKSFPEISISEIADDGLVIEGPRPSCAAGHHLLLRIEVTLASGKAERPIEVTAMVRKAERVSEISDRITLDLLQYEEKEWQRFRGILSSRQDEINEFLQAAKGV